MHPSSDWWASPGALTRYLHDLLQGEMNQLRPAGWTLPEQAFVQGLLWRDDLGADSLEMMSLSAALADALRLRTQAAAQALYAKPSLDNWLQVACQALQAQGEALGFRTSGSTGSPRSCVHRLDALMQEMQAMAEVIGPVKRIITAVRSHHIYGFLFTLLLPHAMGHPGMPVRCLAGRPPLGLDELLQSGDLVVGFPDWWRSVARLGPPVPEGVIALTSTAPCPDDVSQAVLDLGFARLLHIYGSTETAGLGWRDWACAGSYALHPFWQRVPGDDQALQRTGQDGQINCIALQDQITWLDRHHFMPGPRVDGAVQVAGVNVQLAHVRQRLLTHPEIADVALRVHRFGDQDRLKAFVVPRQMGMLHDATTQLALTHQLLDWVRQHLAPPARPAHVTLGPHLPVNAMGKPCDWPVHTGS
jgi:long-chain acyl-CoA synthetase